MAGFLSGMKRVNSPNCVGTLKGSYTDNEWYFVNVEEGNAVVWATKKEDRVMEPSTVKSISLVVQDKLLKENPNFFSLQNQYKIEFNDGSEAVLYVEATRATRQGICDELPPNILPTQVDEQLAYIIKTKPIYNSGLKKVYKLLETLKVELSAPAISNNAGVGNATVSGSGVDISKKAESLELLKELKELLDSGIITQEEFDEQKKSILSTPVVQVVQTPVQTQVQPVQSAPAYASSSSNNSYSSESTRKEKQKAPVDSKRTYRIILSILAFLLLVGGSVMCFIYSGCVGSYVDYENPYKSLLVLIPILAMVSGAAFLLFKNKNIRILSGVISSLSIIVSIFFVFYCTYLCFEFNLDHEYNVFLNRLYHYGEESAYSFKEFLQVLNLKNFDFLKSYIGESYGYVDEYSNYQYIDFYYSNESSIMWIAFGLLVGALVCFITITCLKQHKKKANEE